MADIRPEYRLLDHTADMGIEVRGRNLSDLFTHAGYALIHIMVLERECHPADFMRVSIYAEDREDLLVKWLSEILYLFDGENLIVTSMAIETISVHELAAVLGVVHFDPRKHELLREIKAVTYHQIDVAEENDSWVARVIFDV